MKNENTVNASFVAHFIGDMTEDPTHEPVFVKDATNGAMFLVRSIETAPNGALVLVIEPQPVDGAK